MTTKFESTVPERIWIDNPKPDTNRYLYSVPCPPGLETTINVIEYVRAAVPTAEARTGCVDGEPMMHGPHPYRWCATHDDLMLRCELQRTSDTEVSQLARDAAIAIVKPLSEAVMLGANAKWLEGKIIEAISSVFAHSDQKRTIEATGSKSVADLYLQGSCTDSECKLCHLVPYARKEGMKHAGLSAYGEYPDDPSNQKRAVVQHSTLADEVQRRMDAVVDAAVEWHEGGRGGDDTWFEKGEVLACAIEKLLARRAEPLSRVPTDKADLSSYCEVDDCGHCSAPQCACYHETGDGRCNNQRYQSQKTVRTHR